MSKLEALIEKLSKSSAEAVNTFNSSKDDIVEYLHIETDVEKKYIETLNNNKYTKCLIFLCGSSGDGKSAIINRHLKDYENYFDFHVDATHSFKPNQTAIEALTESFKKYKKSDRSLVIGINIGIMLNFIDNPIEDIIEIQHFIKTFLESKKSSENSHFINFEDYSKFKFEDDRIKAPFIKNLLEKLTLDSNENPFYQAFIKDEENNNTSICHQNFKLLSNQYIQNSIIDLLIQSNLKYDQFLTVRSLLDFIYILLKGPILLVNQIFENDSNEIIKNIKKDDPILNRSFKIDKFILERKSSKTDNKLNEFINGFNKLCERSILDSICPFTLIRTFYLFKAMDISNNFHKDFIEDFDNNNLHNFVELLYIHKKYEDKHKKIVKKFYEDAIASIYFYINKNFPDLVKKNFVVLSSNKDFITSAQIKITPNWFKIKDCESESFQSFPLYLKIDGNELKKPIDISLNMFLMIYQIKDGYRPNKHDRNTIIIFEELIESVLEHAMLSNKLAISFNNTLKVFTKEDDEIEVDDEI